MEFGNSKAMRVAMAWAPAGLLLGFALGIAAHAGSAPLQALTGFLGPLGNLWMNALQLAVIPLVSALLVSGIGGMAPRDGLGRWTGYSIFTFLSLLVLGALLVIGFWAVYSPTFGPSVQPIPAALGAELPKGEALTFGDWIESLLPSNLVQAAAVGQMLPVTLCAILFALAVRRLPESSRSRIVGTFQAIRDAVMVYLSWVLALIPFAAFALAFAFAAESGIAAAGAALHFLLLSCGLLLAMTVLLYVLVAIFGRVSPWRFARAAFPAQVVALGTRSSIASLPSTIQSAKALDLPEPASDVVLPLAVSVFKPNRTVSSTIKLVFVATLFGIALSPADIASFVITVIVLSISSPGIPSMGTRITFGAYLSAGLPPAGILIFEALDPIIDIFKTLLNVTGNLAAATIVSRFAGGRAPSEEPMAALAPEVA